MGRRVVPYGRCPVRGTKKGCSIFFDRKKSIVRRSGENIGVLEVEAALQGHPEIKAIAVTPVPDELRGEEVFAFLRRGDTLDDGNGRRLAEDVVRDSAARLAYHKLPGYVAFIDALPLSSTQKLQRGEIKTMAAELVKSGRAIDLRDLKAGMRRKAGARLMSTGRARKSYEGIVAAVPVTVPYERFSIHPAQWWLGRALRALVDASGVSHRDFDGFAMASFSTGPDTAIGLTQHFGCRPLAGPCSDGRRRGRHFAAPCGEGRSGRRCRHRRLRGWRHQSR